MALFSNSFDEVKPEVLVADGTYNLRIKGVPIMKTAQSGREYLLVVFENLDEPEAQAIFHNVNGLLPDDSDNTRQAMSRMANDFFATFGQDVENPEITALAGEECRAVVKQEEGNDGVTRNRIKKFL